MKKSVVAVMVAVLVLMCGTAMAENVVKFAWDPNPPEEKVVGYRVYQSTVSGNYNKETGKVCDTPDTACTVENVPDGTYFWVATAYDAAGNESAYSNEVTKALDSTPPNPPKGFTAITINIIVGK